MFPSMEPRNVQRPTGVRDSDWDELPVEPERTARSVVKSGLGDPPTLPSQPSVDHFVPTASEPEPEPLMNIALEPTPVSRIPSQAQRPIPEADSGSESIAPAAQREHRQRRYT